MGLRYNVGCFSLEAPWESTAPSPTTEASHVNAGEEHKQASRVWVVVSQSLFQGSSGPLPLELSEGQ